MFSGCPTGAAVAAEVTAEALGKGPGEGSGDASGDAAAKRLRRAADWGRFAAACAAFASGRDVDIAIRSATNAVENNFLTTSPLQQELDSEEEASEDPEAEAARKNQRLSADEIKKRFGERIRIHRDVTAFFYDREECLKNWIEEVFTESPPSPRTRARVEEDWGARYEKLRLATNLGSTPRTALFERDLERGEDYFIQKRVKEFAKGQNLTPEEADHCHRAPAEATLKKYKEQQVDALIGGAIAVAGGLRNAPNIRVSNKVPIRQSRPNEVKPPHVEVDPKKFKYLFGEVNSNTHNAARSNQLSLEMKRLGIMDDKAGHEIIRLHFKETVKNNSNIFQTFKDEYGAYEVRDSLLFGPSGKAVRLENTFQIMEDGTRRYITTIPSRGK